MRVLLAGGGTAGHTSPLIATADALRRLDPDVEITCLGTPARPGEPGRPRGRLPARADPAGAAAAQARRRPAAGAGPAARRGTGDATTVLDRVRPDVVVGYGGYVSMPAYLAARRRKLPLVVHEQNALPGLANKAGARVAAPGRGQLPGHPAAEGGVRRPADPPDDLDARPGGAARRGARLLRARPRPAHAAGHRRLAGRAPAQPVGRPGPPRRSATPGSRCSTSSARRARRTPAADRRPLRRRAASSTGWTSPTPPPTWSCAGPAPPASPRPPPSGCRRSSCRCRSATASRSTTPAPSSTPAAALLVADAALTPEWVAGTRPRPGRPTPTGSPRWARPRPALIPRDADEQLARIVARDGRRR